MGIRSLNNIADINHHLTLGLPGLNLEPKIYYPPRLVLGIVERDEKQRGVSARRKIFPFIPKWVVLSGTAASEDHEHLRPL